LPHAGAFRPTACLQEIYKSRISFDHYKYYLFEIEKINCFKYKVVLPKARLFLRGKCIKQLPEIKDVGCFESNAD